MEIGKEHVSKAITGSGRARHSGAPAPASGPEDQAGRAAVPLVPPVPVASQPLPELQSGRLRPRARPARLEAVEGYGAARKVFEK